VHELLNNPAVQGGFAPFLVALVTAELLQRLRLSGLAIASGFAVTVYLAGGLSFEPLTAMHKIVLLGILSPFLALLLTLFVPSWLLRPMLAATGGAAALWTAQRVLQQHELAVVLLWGAGCAFYAGWLVYWTDRLEAAPVRAGSAGLALGAGTGVSTLFGASALLGLYGMALGAAAGAYLLIQTLTNRHLSCGRSLTLPLSLIAGLTGSLAVLAAELPWYALLPLAAIPLAARIPISEKSGVWLQSMLLSAATLACAAVSVYLTWRVAGALPL
jgi:hypothetical protein